MHLDDTIAAIATPPGRGGVGVVRLAGPEAKAIALPMLRLKHELEPGRAIFGELIEPCGSDITVRQSGSSALVSEQSSESKPCRAGMSDPHGSRIDEVVVTYFAKPHS